VRWQKKATMNNNKIQNKNRFIDNKTYYFQKISTSNDDSIVRIKMYLAIWPRLSRSSIFWIYAKNGQRKLTIIYILQMQKVQISAQVF